MRELNEPNYEKAINNVATALTLIATQQRIQNLLYLNDLHHLDIDGVRKDALDQAKALLGL